jgi:hypothetical protein
MVWKLEESQRLSKWRDFRKSLNNLELEQSLQQTVDWWNRCPWAPFYLDEADPTSWPNPWDLLAENCFCDIAKAYGMACTIYLTDHKPDVTVNIMQDTETRTTVCICIVNEKYVLNMNSGEVLNRTYITKTFTLKHSYTAADLNLHTYI